jgi:hypothetical protein
MRRSTATLLALLALAGCTSHRPQAGDLASSPTAPKRAVVRVDVTNTFGRSIDVYYSATYLGSVGPYGHASYPIPPATGRMPVYATWSGNPQRSFNLSQWHGVRYVYGNVEPSDG